MPIVAKLDELGRTAWIALMILAFFFWWPVGLAILAFLIGSGRMACWNQYAMARWQEKIDRMQEGVDRMRGKFDRLRTTAETWGYPRSSGNRAFDEYRAETLRRLEEEQREFREFLDRLRFAKDKTEFDQFMAERRARSGSSPGPQST
jgi:hypothetical protein